MPNILWSLDFTATQPPELNKFSKMLNKLYQQLARVVNGQISFGNGVSRDNIDGNWFQLTTPATPDTDFLILHNLGRVPVGYLLMMADKATSIYNGTTPPSTTAIVLRSNAASASVSLFIL